MIEIPRRSSLGMTGEEMKIALVHDQLHEFGGAERVFFVLKKMFPEAPVYTAFYTKDRLVKHAPDYKNWIIHDSFAAKIPFIRKLYSPLRFLAPYIWESFDFSAYDVVISSSGWFMCKGGKTHSTDSTSSGRTEIVQRTSESGH